MNRLVPCAAFVALLGAAPSALAGGEARNYLQPTRHWFDPVQIHFDSTDDDSIDGAAERSVVWTALQTWENVACVDIDFVDATVYTGGGVPASDLTWGGDGVSAFVFEDEDCASGVLAYNFPFYIASSTEVVNGRTWAKINESDTAFCRSVDFGTPADVDAPNCVNQYDIQGIATHEMGHGLGYAHTCESSDICSDPQLLGAVMFWAVGACDGAQRFPNDYDLETHSIAYGLGASSTFSVANGSGGLPLDVTFAPQVIASATVLSVAWDFGDGFSETTTGSVAVEHTYEAEGRFSVGAEINATSPSCGGAFTQRVRKFDAVVACNDLEPEFRYEKQGKKVKFFSETLGSASNCLHTLNWKFGDGATSNVRDPIHEYDSNGTYTVELTASGPPGTSDPVEKDISVGGGGGGNAFGCSLDESPSANTAAAAGMLGIAVAMSLATAARRRREY